MTQGLMLAVGIIASIVLVGLASGDWLDANDRLRLASRYRTFAYVTSRLSDSSYRHALRRAIFCVVAWTSERRALRTESGPRICL